MESKDSICKFKFSKNTTTTCPSFLVDFSNGQLKLDESSGLAFTCYRHVADLLVDSKARLILVANNGRLDYKGTSFDEDHGYKLPVRYSIGVRSKITGRMKIYDCILFHLKPVMKVAVSPQLKTEEMNYRERIDLLSMSFGNKSKKRAINARLKYSVESSPALTDALEDITLNEPSSPMTPGKFPLGVSAAIDYIPPQNHNAEAAREVYNIRDIITEEEDEHLTCKAEMLLKEYSSNGDDTKWKNDATYCKYVTSHLRQHPDVETVKYLLYYDYLVIFSKLGHSDIRKKDPIPDIHEPFKSKLLNCFTISSQTESGKTTRTYPQRMKDKVFAYLFVLALIIDDYCVNIPLVLEDVKRGVLSGITVAQALGCHIIQRRVNDSTMKFAELKLPLFVLHRYSKKRY